MSPIDDELRATLHGRAQALAPSPDPLAGIERRAKKIRRNRTAVAVAGSALAVAMIAVAVPALQSATSSGPEVPQFATAGPSAEAEVGTSPYALDPRSPWTFRGTAVDEGSRATVQREYATLRQGAEVLVTPLFAQVYEPSQQLEVVFLAEVDGRYRWGVAQSSESGPEFLWDEPLPEPALALAAALPGDEVPRLLVVAAPEVDEMAYGPVGATEHSPMALIDDGVAVTPLEGERDADSYLVFVADEQVHRADAPDPADEQLPGQTDRDADAASYGLDLSDPWPFRGVGDPTTLAADDERLFRQTKTTRASQQWSTRPLYAARSDGGVEYLFMLHTAPGQQAVVTTTYRVDGQPVRQSEQVVRNGQQLIQALVPTSLSDGAVVLVGLASDRAGGIVLEQDGTTRPDGIGHPGVGLWVMDADEIGTGRILLYTQGDGLEYHAEDVRPS